MRLQKEVLRLCEGDHVSYDWERDLPDVQVELSESAMLAGAIRGLDVRHDRPIPRPREDVGAIAIRAEHRDDLVAEDRLEAERPLVRRARDERRRHAE